MNHRAFQVVLLGLLGLILGVPFLARPAASSREQLPADRTLIIITPHVQQITREFASAFESWHERTHGAKVRVDARGPIGTSELLKLLQAQYTAAIKRGDIKPDGSCEPGVMTYDLLFGGGSFDHGRVKDGVTVATGASGEDGKATTVTVSMSVPAGFEQATLDEWFGENRIGSQRLYEPGQYWIGAALSSFGIVYNRDVYADLGLPEPLQFADLGRPELAGWIALADPRQSGSIATALDSILNNEVWRVAREEGWEEELDAALSVESKDRSKPWVKALWATRGVSIQRAWDTGWRTLREMCANTRYFTNASTKPPIDVSQGEAAAGLSIDFYGRGQSQFVTPPGGSASESRVGYVDPRGATYIDADPISLLRGGPNPELAKRFIEFCMSEEGQALWQFPARTNPRSSASPTRSDGEPMGPARHELRRMPIRRVMYEKFAGAMVDSGLTPYETASDTKTVGWRSAIGVMMGAFAIDVGDEQRDAWRALTAARRSAAKGEFPTETLERMESMFYSWPVTPIPADDRGNAARELTFTPENVREILASWRSSPAQAARCRIAYTTHYRESYAEIQRLARSAAK